MSSSIKFRNIRECTRAFPQTWIDLGLLAFTLGYFIKRFHIWEKQRYSFKHLEGVARMCIRQLLKCCSHPPPTPVSCCECTLVMNSLWVWVCVVTPSKSFLTKIILQECWDVLIRLNMQIFWSCSTRHLSKWNENYDHAKICTQMFVTALVIIVKKLTLA